MKIYQLPIKHNSLRTRDDLLQGLRQICDPLKPHYSKGCAYLHLGNTSAAYPDAIAEMEGFSRVLWGLIPLLAGGEEYDLWELHLEGIKNGTDPSHEEYWGEINGTDQRMVEMAALGLALALIPEKIWEPLNDKEKENLITWLDQINHYQVYECNWLFFPVLVNLGFKYVGTTYNQECISRNLERIDQFYLSNGWYSDGIGGHADYYNPFALQYYSLIYAKLMEEEDPERSLLYKRRAEMFARDFIYWFADDGSAIPYGRSMTYRFAQSAFWSALVFAEVEVFSYGEMRGLILNNLRWWFQQPIFNRDGTLTIGYRYPNLIIGENYNSPGSPYWALKTFLILALKEDHPFWKAEEQRLPQLKDKSIQKPAHLIVCRQETTGHILAFNSGHHSTNEHTHTSAKYEKFVYSNYFGYSVPRAEWGLDQGAFDSILALSEGDNLYRVKRNCEDGRIEEGVVYSKWKPWSDVEVNTWIIPGAPWHLRIHRIHTKRELDTAEGGFALGMEDPTFNHEKGDTYQDEEGALARFPWGASGIKTLCKTGKPVLVFPNSNTNIMSPRTVIPTIRSKIYPGTSWLVSSVYGEPGSDLIKSNWAASPYVEMEKDKILVFTSKEKKVLFQKNMI